MGRPFGVEFERRHDRPSVVRRRARTGQSPDPRAAGTCPAGPRAACPFPGSAPRSSPGVVRSLGRLRAVQFAGRHPETDLSPGAWVADGTAGARWPTVAALLPRGFAGYARVFHPAYRYDGDDDVEVSWREIAEDNGATPHPLMQWPGVTGGWE